MPKIVEIKYTYNNSILEVRFNSAPIKGWHAKNIQPVLELLKTAIPPSGRSYDPKTFTWSFGAEYFKIIEPLLIGCGWTIKTIGSGSASGKSKVDDFFVPKNYEENFYNNPITTKVESKQTIAQALASLLGITEDLAKVELSALKKKYREAARKFHPDFGGESDKMSELNRLWFAYKCVR